MRAVTALSASAEHRALADAIAGVAERAGVRAAARSRLDEPGAASLPGCWIDLAKADLLAVAVDGDPLDVAVAACELGRALAPGPVTSTLAAAVLVQRFGTDDARSRISAGLSDGTWSGSVWWEGLVVGGSEAAQTLAPVDGIWSLVDTGILALPGPTPGLAHTAALAGMDPTRGLLAIDQPGLRAEQSGGENSAPLTGITDADVSETLTTLLAAEACGVAAWCVETAVDYALVRQQFGRPIGGFQAVKHRCADLYCDLELALAATWDAAAALAARVAGDGSGAADPREVELAVAVAVANAVEAAVGAAKGLVQILGGIGFTWEHDAHVYLKRALALRQLLGGAGRWRQRAAALALAGVRRPRHLDLGAHLAPVAGDVRDEVREFLQSIADADGAEQRRRIVDAGLLTPHWPKPYGRESAAAEQLVIDEEFARAGIVRPDLVIGNWAVPTILAHGSDAQRERFVRPTLLGEITWCQMFSEPGAGSDLASLTTKASRVDGGWSLSGQKVWTSTATTADWAICLARTSTGERRHDGITYFLVDMSSPGLDVRPLRELTGQALFNEIFLTEVFVPDDCVVGEVDGGWRLARTTLANERVSMSSGSAFPSGIEDLLDAVRAAGGAANAAVLERVGELVCRAQADAMLGLRATLAQVSGTDPGAASSIRKLVGMHLRQDAAELGLELLGPKAATLDDETSRAALHRTLASRALTIAGGTSEILHNVIGERILGLPR